MFLYLSIALLEVLTSLSSTLGLGLPVLSVHFLLGGGEGKEREKEKGKGRRREWRRRRRTIILTSLGLSLSPRPLPQPLSPSCRRKIHPYFPSGANSVFIPVLRQNTLQHEPGGHRNSRSSKIPAFLRGAVYGLYFGAWGVTLYSREILALRAIVVREF
jgi:hypothetical protein